MPGRWARGRYGPSLAGMTERCHLVSPNRDEPLPGTAATARAWLLIEDVGPWGHDALAMSSVPPPVAATVAAHAIEQDVRIQMIRRPDRKRTKADRRVVYVCHSGPGTPWTRRLLLTDDELSELDLSMANRREPPADFGKVEEHDVFLVCTHAKRDACCAQWGRPVADKIAKKVPDTTWETSHTGGHRFAGVLLVLPEGLTFGRMEPSDVATLVNALGNGRIPLEHYRGRSVDGGPGQAAEVAVRKASGVSGRGAVRVTGARKDGGAHVVAVTADGALWRAVVASRPLGTLRALSCGGHPEDRMVHEVVSVGASA